MSNDVEADALVKLSVKHSDRRLIRETHDVSTPRELESHVDYEVPLPVVGQRQQRDTASGSRESEAARGSSGVSGRGKFVYRGSAAAGVV